MQAIVNILNVLDKMVYIFTNSLLPNFFRLFFWIYRPHQLLGKYYSICLFDDHGVDNMMSVTICQWFSSSRTLIVHGASEYENEDSFVSIVAVPRLGCLDCRQMRDEHYTGNQSDGECFFFVLLLFD